MSIRSIGSPYGPQRPAAPAPAAPASKAEGVAPAATGGQPTAGAPAAARRDSVAISDAGRALAGGGAEAAVEAGGLTPERVADLRRKVLEGAYNQASAVDRVAQRLLASGDV